MYYKKIWGWRERKGIEKLKKNIRNGCRQENIVVYDKEGTTEKKAKSKSREESILKKD